MVNCRTSSCALSETSGGGELSLSFWGEGLCQGAEEPQPLEQVRPGLEGPALFLPIALGARLSRRVELSLMVTTLCSLYTPKMRGPLPVGKMPL